MELSEQLHRVEQIANLGSYQTNLTTGIWTASSNFKTIFGLPEKEEYTVEEFQALVHPDDFEDVMEYFNQCLIEQKDFNYEYRCIRPDGKMIYVNSRSQVHYGPDGQPLKIVGIKQDITKRKLYEQQLEELNNLNKKKNDALKIVAHDLRSPLAHIEGVIDLIKDDLNEEQLQLVNFQAKACELSKSIVEELIEIARLESNTYDLELHKYDLNELVLQAIEHVSFKANAKEIDICTSLGDEIIALLSPKKFIRVIDNLLSNAIKFTPVGKTITVLTEQKEGKLILKVIDEGIGIPQEHISKLFDQFSKDVRRKGTEGERSIGLGLNIVKQIVDLHNGIIEVESKENKGSVFSVILDSPLIAEQQEV
ncbi:MAG: PAS domain S-box protein [Balneolaceae bacterium]|nr:PAS domain S-box protein [Balneolaceae bacterium]